MLPLHAEEDDDGGKQRGASAPPSLLEAIAWGSVAECITSVGCPLRMYGSMDLTATGLNLVCPFLCGMAAAIDEEAIDAGADPGTRRRVAAFQVGFIGVSTSFSFMAEQAAWLGGLRAGALYILGTLATTCVVFSIGRAALASALRTRRLRRALRTGQLLPSSSRLLRMLSLLVALTWVWVLLAPAGAVFEPLAMRHSTSSGRGALVHASRELGVVEQDGLQRQADDAAASLPPPPSSPSKQADVLHLLVGLLMQGAGLALSARIDRWAAGASHAAAERRAAHRGSSASGAQTAVHWSPLLCNSLACAVVLALRVGEAARLIGGDDALLATKLRTSGCGALSVSGGLATLLITPSGDGSGADGGGGGGSPQQHLLQGGGDYGERGRERRSRLQSIRVIGLNLSLHALVAVATCILLPLLTSWASGEAAAEARAEI